MAYVFKIKFQNTLRRVLIEEGDSGEPDLTFKQLEEKVRGMFKISSSDSFVITYTDQENDAVTMGNDQDIFDACVIQKLNPLRLDVKVENLKAKTFKSQEETSTSNVSVLNATEQAKAQGDDSIECNLKGFIPNKLVDKAKERLSEMGLPQEVVSKLAEDWMRALPAGGSKYFSLSSTQKTSNATNPTPTLSTLHVAENAARIFHKGVQCDFCGMRPIVGPRFNSIKRENYDLCSSCFMHFGNETDYRKIEKPVYSRRHSHHHHHPLHGGRMIRHPLGPPIPHTKLKHDHPIRCSPYWNGNAIGEHYNGKLDARFVQDVTIFDGTEVAAGTTFTKIWRLRNIGTLPWPHLTQVVNVGGDILGSGKPVVLELPEQGLACDKEIDASVDLVAPYRPGRYVSHWRLMAPSGQKFGQRVWVLIQVVPQDRQLTQDTPIVPSHVWSDSSSKLEQLNQLVSATESLTLSAHNDGDGDMLKVPPEPLHSSGNAVQMVEDSSDVVKSDAEEFSLIDKPADDSKFVQQSEQSSRPGPENLSHISHPSMPEDLSSITYQLVDLPMPKKSDNQNVNQEDNFLEILNHMGFTQKALNLELLRKNNNNLQSTIDDLVTGSGWDHMLEDLEEMGFYDMETNRRLLLKNKGSVKLVVKELLQMQTSEQNQQPKTL